ncbi:MAG: hypothetical protein IH968_19430 [Gemmatimonadetes bacterium]|nr:hypothetical protein [Gemmatimonadota bacterium]
MPRRIVYSFIWIIVVRPVLREARGSDLRGPSAWAQPATNAPDCRAAQVIALNVIE